MFVLRIKKVLSTRGRELSARIDIDDEQWRGRMSLSDKIEVTLSEDQMIMIQNLALSIPEICSDFVHKIVTEKLSYNNVGATHAHS